MQSEDPKNLTRWFGPFSIS